jgi:glycosyltransferase involved in cell wall biosynthesis
MTELPHGVDLGVMKYSKDKEELFRQRFDIREDDPVVLSVGHLLLRKDIRTFFNIAKKLPDEVFLGRSLSYIP